MNITYTTKFGDLLDCLESELFNINLKILSNIFFRV